LPARQQVGSDADESDDEHELRQCQQLGDGAMGAEHQCCAKRHEVAGYVGSEESLRAEKAGGVDETAGEAQESGKRVVSHHSLQWSLRARSRPRSDPCNRMVAAMRRGAGVAYFLDLAQLVRPQNPTGGRC
jgi:hypothetical protein